MSIIDGIKIPESAGCYLFKDNKGQIIYVGKSKFLPNRVSSYFRNGAKDIKTVRLVESISSVEFVTTESETEALSLEEDLIKLYRPKFNIKGKDDKSIKSKLVLVDEEWPRIELVYSNIEIKGEILCQFTSGKLANEVYDIIHDIFELRSCSYNLDENSINSNKFKPCLEYQMKRCMAPCAGIAKKFEYMFNISKIKEILKFNFEPYIKYLTKKRNYFSKCLEFEQSHIIQNKIEKLKTLQELLKPVVENETRKELVRLKNVLNLKNIPLNIEAFDNSHHSGQFVVSCMVKYFLGSPDRKSYRKYIIKDDPSADDCSSFAEVLARRYTRLIKEKSTLPDLIIIDGGVGQLNVAKQILLELDLINKIDVISISKDKRHRSNVVHTIDESKISILKNKLYLFSKIQDEVHRFVLDFHTLRKNKL